MWRRIYQRKLLFWIGMYLSIAFGSASGLYSTSTDLCLDSKCCVFTAYCFFVAQIFRLYTRSKRSQLTGQAYPGLFVCAVQCHVSMQCLAVVGIFVAAAGHYGFDRKWY